MLVSPSIKEWEVEALDIEYNILVIQKNYEKNRIKRLNKILKMIYNEEKNYE